MKKFLFICMLLLGFSANAQTIQPISNTEPLKVESPSDQTQPNAEAQGYSIAFLAYHYNDACNLGISKEIIDNLAAELAKAEQNNEITQETIDKNVADVQKLYKEDPKKFCQDAQQIATVIKNMFSNEQQNQ